MKVLVLFILSFYAVLSTGYQYEYEQDYPWIPERSQDRDQKVAEKGYEESPTIWQRDAPGSEYYNGYVQDEGYVHSPEGGYEDSKEEIYRDYKGVEYEDLPKTGGYGDSQGSESGSSKGVKNNNIKGGGFKASPKDQLESKQRESNNYLPGKQDEASVERNYRKPAGKEYKNQQKKEYEDPKKEKHGSLAEKSYIKQPGEDSGKEKGIESEKRFETKENTGEKNKKYGIYIREHDTKPTEKSVHVTKGLEKGLGAYRITEENEDCNGQNGIGELLMLLVNNMLGILTSVKDVESENQWSSVVDTGLQRVMTSLQQLRKKIANFKDNFKMKDIGKKLQNLSTKSLEKMPDILKFLRNINNSGSLETILTKVLNIWGNLGGAMGKTMNAVNGT